MSRFVDEFFSRDLRISLGEDTVARKKYLSFPVANPYIEYEEHYALTAGEYAEFKKDWTAAVAFADAARRREKDDRLILQPGQFRGSPT